MSRTDPQFNLRIPESLRDWVMTAAKQNKRSATAEILARLERSFTEPDNMGVCDLDRMDPESVFYTQSAGDPGVTFKIDKEKLIAVDEVHRTTALGPGGAPDQKVSEALRRAFKALEEIDMMVGLTATPKGPKSRKRYPKE
ncbi:Arc family DNA-binding protein [Pseudomonas sp. IT-P253]|uniref:Arc family DNA-binding protein n=1 Tax=Pseudomonas sp. IT-P253 TaxID=3026455 RepID=UPI0039E05F31